MTLTPVVTVNPDVLYESCTDNIDLPPEEVPVISDALVSARLVFMDAFSAGKTQSLGDIRGTGGVRIFGRYDDITGIYDYFETGGRNGGGYIVCTNTDGRLAVKIASSSSGRYYLGTDETPPTQGGITTIHNLLGKTISGPTLLQGLGFHAKVEVMPNLTLRVVDFNNVVLGTPTALTVPSTGWFALESYIGVAPALLTSGGFVVSNLYVADGPAIGVPIIRSTGFNVYEGVGPHNLEVYFAYLPQDTGFCGLAIMGPYGTEKKWMYDLILTNAWPTAPGDKTESIRTYEHYEPWGHNLDGSVTNFGPPGGMHWGDEARWKNVISKTHSGYIGDEPLILETAAGELSIFTDRWLSGPFYPADSFDPVERNTFVGESTDFYKTTIEDVGIVEIEAIGTFALSGARSWREQAGGFAFPKNWWNFCGPYPYVPGHPLDFAWPNNFVQSGSNYGSCSAVYEQLLKTSDGDIVVTRMGVAMAVSGEWRGELGYTLDPDLMLDKDPSTSKRWTLDSIPQVGVRGSFALNDALDVPLTGDDRWNQFDIGQLALDIAGRSQIITVTELVKHPPVAAYKTVSFNAVSGALVIYDISVDFNGDTSTLTSNIVSRVMDWGDGTTESIPVGVIGDVAIGQVTHNYNADGSTYTAKLTVTNSNGLTNFTTKTFVTAIGVITASFSAALDSGDVTGKTVIFTDLSSVDGGSVVGWNWNFGDGNTSNLQNPTHIYATYDTFIVNLTATGNHSQTDIETQDLEISEPISGGDCSISAIALLDTAYIMADDFNGGNPPLPAYLNTAAFAAIYWDEDPFREAYDNQYAAHNDGIHFAIDTTKIFNSHNTYRMGFGHPALLYVGGGWDTWLTDDGDPTETYNINCHGLWQRIRWVAESGVMSDVTVADGDVFEGLNILDTNGGSAETSLMARGGNLHLDTSFRESLGGAFVTHTFTISNDSLFIGRGDDKFGELIQLSEIDNDANTYRIRIWAGDACSLDGTLPTPLLDETLPCFTANTVPAIAAGNAIRFVGHFNWNFFPAGAIKYLWVADWEKVPTSVSADPFNLLS